MSSSLQKKKAKLLKESDKIEESLNEEFSEFSEKAFNLGGKILAIGGGALISYFIVKAIIGKDENDTTDDRIKERIIVKSSAQNTIIRSLTDKAALVILEIARELIVRFLKDLPERNEQ